LKAGAGLKKGPSLTERECSLVSNMAVVPNLRMSEDTTSKRALEKWLRLTCPDRRKLPMMTSLKTRRRKLQAGAML